MVYPEEYADDEVAILGHEAQLVTEMMDFVGLRHSRNHPEKPTPNIDVYYDTAGNSSVIDAWFARLTDADLLDFEDQFPVSFIFVTRV